MMAHMRERGKASEINRAAEKEPKSGHKAPAKAGVGNEKTADMKGALMGSPEDGNPLKGAMKELGRQHPHHFHDHGPHHDHMGHKRHMPLHGLKG